MLRALPEKGQIWDDPSEDGLFLLLEDIESGEAGAFLIVERTSDPSGQTYAQVMRRSDGSYRVEHREGDSDHHYGAVAADMRAAHRLLAGWAFNIDGWQISATWSQI